MKGIWAIMRMSFITYFRDRSAMFWGILFPLLLMGLIGMALGGGEVHFNVAVVAPDAVGESDAIGEPEGPSAPEAREGVSAERDGRGLRAGLLTVLRAVPAFTVEEVGMDEGLAGLESDKYALVVALPEQALSVGAAPGPTPGSVLPPESAVGAGSSVGALPQPLPIEVYYDGTNEQAAQVGLTIVRQAVHQLNQRLTGRTDLVQVVATERRGEGISMFDFLLPGIIAMILMQTGLMGVTWVVANYRERLILKRVMATPFHPLGFLTGLIGRFTVVNLFQAAIVFVVATYLFGAKTTGSLGEYTLLALWGSITFLAIGFAISTLSRTAESANNLGSLVAFPMMFLSGVFWPPEIMPEAIQPIVALLPLTPLVEAMRGVATSGMHVADFLPGLSYMGLWLAASLVVAARRFRWE